MSEPERCNHELGLHLRPVVLASWREGDLVLGFSRFARVRCYACGHMWLETCHA